VLSKKQRGREETGRREGGREGGREEGVVLLPSEDSGGSPQHSLLILTSVLNKKNDSTGNLSIRLMRLIVRCALYMKKDRK